MAMAGYQAPLTASPHAVIYRPENKKRPWQVVNLATDRVIGSYASEEHAATVAAIGSLRGARPGAPVRNLRTGEIGHLIFAWPGHLEVALTPEQHRRWPFTHCRLGQPTGAMLPVAQTPHALHSLIQNKHE